MNKPTKVVLITGASSGIGKALALVYARQGYHGLLTGRNETELQEATADRCR